MHELINGVPFPVAVRFDSDWMCGTGTGRYGATDRQLQRDRGGLPMVRGKMLAAMLRDAAETVARGLDAGTGERTWRAWTDYVFGSQPAVDRDLATAAPRPSVLQPRPLRLTGTLRRLIGADPARELLADTTVVLRAGVRIDRGTGTAADDMLRVEERARAGLAAEGEWTVNDTSLPVGEPVRWEAELLLRAATRMVTAIGGKRRRGAGRCRVSIGTGDQPRLIELLERIDQAGPPPGHRSTAPPTVTIGERAHELVPRFELRVTAQCPLILGHGLRGNIVLTEKFVPGGTLLPLVARAVAGGATDAITGGRLVVTDATVEIAGARSLPTPLCLVIPRDAPDGPAHNMLGRSNGVKGDSPGEYCLPVAARAHFVEPRTVDHGHGVIDDDQQRPNERSGGLYINRALEDGTTLRAEIWASPDVEFDTDGLRGTRSLGRSRKDDYGQVHVEVVPLQAKPTAPPNGRPLTVWLGSDLLLHGERGQPDPTAERLAAVLGDALDVTLTPRDSSFKVRRRESWQTRWGLPRPSMTVLQAGSVFRFDIGDRPIDPDAWRRVHASGIGERTAEGFGRLVLDPLLLNHETIDRLGDAPATTVPDAGRSVPDAADAPLDSDPLDTDAKRLLVLGWRAEIRDRILAVAADSGKRRAMVKAGVTPTQLGGLRALAARLPESTRAIQNWEHRGGLLTELLDGDGAAMWELLDVLPPAEVRAALRDETLRLLLTEMARTEVRHLQSGQGGEEDQ